MQKLKVMYSCLICNKIYYIKDGDNITAAEFFCLDDDYHTETQDGYCVDCLEDADENTWK